MQEGSTFVGQNQIMRSIVDERGLNPKTDSRALTALSARDNRFAKAKLAAHCNRSQN